MMPDILYNWVIFCQKDRAWGPDSDLPIIVGNLEPAYPIYQTGQASYFWMIKVKTFARNRNPAHCQWTPTQHNGATYNQIC